MKTAMCCVCPNSPLVSTFHFPKKEFYCLDCGRKYEFFGPKAAESTPEIIELSEQYTAEWSDNTVGLITPRGRHLDTCEKCKGGESHDQHATEEEWAAHEKATGWMRQRVKVEQNV